MSRSAQPFLAGFAPVTPASRPGRRAAPGARVLHRSRAAFRRGEPCHVTLRVREDVPSLRSVRLVRELERSFADACERGEFRLVHYSLQGNHAHLIVEAKDRGALGRGMKSIAARLARAVNRVFRRKGPVLADRYRVRVLTSPRQVRNAIAYVLLNARKHMAEAGRKLSLTEADVDPASSGRWFDGWKRGSEPTAPPEERSPVAEPRFWLLATGWRRRGGGLIHPAEIPGH